MLNYKGFQKSTSNVSISQIDKKFEEIFNLWIEMGNEISNIKIFTGF